MKKETDVSTLKKVIEMYEHELDYKMIIEVYKKYFTLSPSDTIMLNKFIDFLYLYGPEWDEEVEKMINYIEMNDFEKARQVALSISY